MLLELDVVPAKSNTRVASPGFPHSNTMDKLHPPRHLQLRKSLATRLKQGTASNQPLSISPRVAEPSAPLKRKARSEYPETAPPESTKRTKSADTPALDTEITYTNELPYGSPDSQATSVAKGNELPFSKRAVPGSNITGPPTADNIELAFAEELVCGLELIFAHHVYLFEPHEREWIKERERRVEGYEDCLYSPPGTARASIFQLWTIY